MAAKPKKTWSDKLAGPQPHWLKPVPRDMAGMKQGQLMLIPSARMVDDFIRQIPAGSSLSPRAARGALASAHGAEVACPVTFGIHLRTVAEAAWEASEAGTPWEEVTPVWRVLDETAPTTRKLTYDWRVLTERRVAEGLKP